MWGRGTASRPTPVSDKALAGRLRIGERPAAEHPGVALDRGQRRAQFVAGVGNEAALLRQGLLPLAKGDVEPREEVVEGRGEAAQFVAGTLYGQAAGEIALADLTRGVDDGVDRREGRAGEQVGAGDREEQPDRDADDDDGCEGDDAPAEVVVGLPGLDDARARVAGRDRRGVDIHLSGATLDALLTGSNVLPDGFTVDLAHRVDVGGGDANLGHHPALAVADEQVDIALGQFGQCRVGGRYALLQQLDRFDGPGASRLPHAGLHAADGDDGEDRDQDRGDEQDHHEVKDREAPADRHLKLYPQ